MVIQHYEKELENLIWLRRYLLNVGHALPQSLQIKLLDSLIDKLERMT